MCNISSDFGNGLVSGWTQYIDGCRNASNMVREKQINYIAKNFLLKKHVDIIYSFILYWISIFYWLWALSTNNYKVKRAQLTFLARWFTHACTHKNKIDAKQAFVFLNIYYKEMP